MEEQQSLESGSYSKQIPDEEISNPLNGVDPNKVQSGGSAMASGLDDTENKPAVAGGSSDPGPPYPPPPEGLKSPFGSFDQAQFDLSSLLPLWNSEISDEMLRIQKELLVKKSQQLQVLESMLCLLNARNQKN